MAIDLNDLTRNQHFLSQVEQRLNAIDPNLNRPQIFQLEVSSRNPVELGPAKSKAIANNLSMLDLFSFDVDKGQPFRQNFEALFNRYEQDVSALTKSLLAKVASGDNCVEVEVKNLHAAKLLNFARNPFSIKEVLNTFGALGNCMPLRPDINDLFKKILLGRRKHQKYLCAALGITDSQYEQWLRMLFNLLIGWGPGSPPMLDQIVEQLFEAKDFAIGVMVSTYSSPSCLLSDRGFSTNIDSNAAQCGFDFNLNAQAFIRYITISRLRPDIPAYIPQAAVDAYMSKRDPIRIYYAVDDVELLRSFNINVISQCHRHVYCAINRDIVY